MHTHTHTHVCVCILYVRVGYPQGHAQNPLYCIHMYICICTKTYYIIYYTARTVCSVCVYARACVRVRVCVCVVGTGGMHYI